MCLFRYNSHKYHDAPIVSLFNSEFGRIEDRKHVCAFGFEPTSKWTPRLTRLNTNLTSQGYGVVIFTETAVGTSNGQATFYVDNLPGEWGGAKNNAWASSLIQHNPKMKASTVGLLRLADFLQLYIYKRNGADQHSKIIAKIDIEGAEYEVIPDVIKQKALCGIDRIIAEIHPFLLSRKSPQWMSRNSFLRFMNTTIEHTPGCKTVIIDFDDESYRVDSE